MGSAIEERARHLKGFKAVPAYSRAEPLQPPPPPLSAELRAKLIALSVARVV